MSLPRRGHVLFEYDHTSDARGPQWDNIDARYVVEGDAGYKRWTVKSVVWSGKSWSYILESNEVRAAADGEQLRAAVTDLDNNAWVPAMYDGEDDSGEEKWIIHPRRANPEDVTLDDRHAVRLRLAPKTPADLTFEMIERSGSRTAVNGFLNGADDGLVHHALGEVGKWKRAFVGRYHGAVVSTIVLHFYNPSKNGSEIAITRLANHESAPPNTSSWMIAKARDWAERYGYERLATYAGVGKNAGTCYKAAGFEPEGGPVVRDSTDWDRGSSNGRDSEHPTVTVNALLEEFPDLNEPGELSSVSSVKLRRTLDELAVDDQQLWLRQKFVDELNPEKYASKDPEWARESVCDGTHVPSRDGIRILQCKATAH